jgi:Ca-activated chloride channel family protein
MATVAAGGGGFGASADAAAGASFTNSAGGAAGANSVGVSVGGAQDATTFRRNVEEGYVPQPTAMTYEGLYHDYYFDTGTPDCDRRFCPSVSTAVSRDPLSNETEWYATVGLHSGLSRADFERKPLNLVVVVDTSGSMDDRFTEYYYDEERDRRVREGNRSAPRKIGAARQAVLAMTDHLGEDDRLGVVQFSNRASVVRPMSRVTGNESSLREQVGSLRADGGTNLDAGMRTATGMAAEYAGNDSRATRVVYVTDAMPNLGRTDSDALRTRLSGHAAGGIHSTFVGVGVDFNTRFVESVNGVEGANYYSVDSADAFRERMDEGFDYMVTPLAYDLSLSVQSGGWEVANVYGVPSRNASADELFHVETLFPSRREGNSTEGSVILLEFDRRSDGSNGNATGNATAGDPVEVVASYETPAGERHTVTRTARLGDHEPAYFESTGVRKAVALTRYADLLRNWAAYERARAAGGGGGEPTPRPGPEPTPPEPTPLPGPEPTPDSGFGEAVERSDGIESRPDAVLGQWEQTSVRLRVSAVYRDRIATFTDHFAAERQALDSDRMDEDLELLRTLVAEGDDEDPEETPTPRPPTPTPDR